MDEHTSVVNVDGVVVRDGEYLCIERAAGEAHASGVVGFPGGKVEHESGSDDPIERTAARELREEVGVEVGEVEYVCSRTFEADDGTRCLNVVTLCEHEGGEPSPRAPDEVAAVSWLSAEELRARADVPEYIEAYVERVEAFRAAERPRERPVSDGPRTDPFE